MIHEISYERISHYWKIYLWPERYNSEDEIPKYNLESKDGYLYHVIKGINPRDIDLLIKPVYIAFYENHGITGVLSGYNSNTDYFRIRGLWVDTNLRRQGIASKMLKYFESNTNKKYIWSIPRESALPFYLNRGFKVTGECCATVYGQTYFVRKQLCE